MELGGRLCDKHTGDVAVMLLPRVPWRGIVEASRHATHARRRGPRRAVVVTQADSDLAAIVQILDALEFETVAARDFQAARYLLADPPNLLVSELRLGRYNGLHLALYAKACRPPTAALVTASAVDSAVRRDAEQIGCTLVVVPTTRQEWLAAIMRTVTRRPLESTECIRPPFERRERDRRVCPDPSDDVRRLGRREDTSTDQ